MSCVQRTCSKWSAHASRAFGEQVAADPTVGAVRLQDCLLEINGAVKQPFAFSIRTCETAVCSRYSYM